MNELLEYLKEIVGELQEMSRDFNCSGLMREHLQIISIIEGLRCYIKYHEGFAFQKDKEKKDCQNDNQDEKLQSKLVILLAPQDHGPFFRSDFYKNYIKD
jgi:hypothetical protein